MCLLALVGVLCLPLSARVSLCLPPFIHLFPSIGGRVRLSGFLSSSVSFHLPCRFGDCFHVFEALFPFVSFCLQLSWLGRWRMGFWSFCFPLWFSMVWILVSILTWPLLGRGHKICRMFSFICLPYYLLGTGSAGMGELFTSCHLFLGVFVWFPSCPLSPNSGSVGLLEPTSRCRSVHAKAPSLSTVLLPMLCCCTCYRYFCAYYAFHSTATTTPPTTAIATPTTYYLLLQHTTDSLYTPHDLPLTTHHVLRATYYVLSATYYVLRTTC